MKKAKTVPGPAALQRMTKAAPRLAAAAALILIPACATIEEEPEQTRANPDADLVKRLEERIKDLEGRLSAMNEKLDASRVVFESSAVSGPEKVAPAAPLPLTTEVVASPPSAGTGETVTSGEVAAKSKDPGLDEYRKGLALFEAGKNTSAILAFAHFIQFHSDHPLVGSAQYHMGEAHFLDGNQKLALQEYGKLLTSYDRSPYASYALSRMSELEARMGNAEESARHRQLLLSLFPQSPAAQSAMNSGAAEKAPSTTSGEGDLPGTETGAGATEPASQGGVNQQPPSAPLRNAPEPRSESGLDLPPTGAHRHFSPGQDGHSA